MRRDSGALRFDVDQKNQFVVAVAQERRLGAFVKKATQIRVAKNGPGWAGKLVIRRITEDTMALSSNRAVLNLTSLEERCCPTASIFAQSGVLSVSTDVFSDTVLIRDNGRGQMQITVRDHSGVETLTANGISQIDMHLRGQNDWVDIVSTGPMINSLSVRVDMGQGANDRVFVEMQQRLEMGALDLEFSGKLGHSAIDTTIGPISHGALDFQDHLSDSQSLSNLHIQSLPDNGQRIYVG